MSEVRKYSIVDVPMKNGDLAVTIVPHKWIYNGEMLCPKDAMKESAASKAYADPDESFTLKACTVRKTYSSYDAARKMLPFASDTDGLASEKELGKGRRKKKKNKKFSLSDSDEGPEKKSKLSKSSQSQAALKPLPPPPQVKHQSSGDHLISLLQKRQHMQKSVTTPNPHQKAGSTKLVRSPISKGIESMTNQGQGSNFPKPHKNPLIQEIVTNKEKEKNGRKLNDSTNVVIQAKQADSECSPGPSHSQVQHDSSSDNESDAGNSDSGNFIPHLEDSLEESNKKVNEGLKSFSEDSDSGRESKAEETIVEEIDQNDTVKDGSSVKISKRDANGKRKNNPVTYKIISKASPLHSKDVMALFQRILIKQQLILTKQVEMDHKLDLVLGHVAAGDGASKPEGWPDSFPLKNMLALLEFESALNTSEFFDFAVRHFSVVVGMGSDARTMAVEICKKLFHKDLAHELNWQGSTAKKGISKMGVGELILDAVSKRYEGKYTKSTVTGAISTWLRNQA